jgi:hypothetical protein
VKQVLAAIGAVAMVVAAVAIRGALDGDSDRGPSGGGSSPTVVCTPELLDVCQHLDGVEIVEQPATDTAAAIQAGALSEDVAGWVTSSAWAEVLDTRAPEQVEEVVALGVSPVAVAVDPARSEALADTCSDRTLWRCLGDESGRAWADLGGDPGWGALKVGLPTQQSASGLAILASVASGFFGTTDFASNDFDASGFGPWLASLAAPSGAGEEDPVVTLVTARGKYSGAGAVQAVAQSHPVDVLAPLPEIDTTIVLVTLEGRGDLPDPAPLRDALADAGWATSAGQPDAILKPGVMAALLTLWTEVLR